MESSKDQTRLLNLLFQTLRHSVWLCFLVLTQKGLILPNLLSAHVLQPDINQHRLWGIDYGGVMVSLPVAWSMTTSDCTSGQTHRTYSLCNASHCKDVARHPSSRQTFSPWTRGSASKLKGWYFFAPSSNPVVCHKPISIYPNPGQEKSQWRAKFVLSTLSLK